jgi:hypothetical protein
MDHVSVSRRPERRPQPVACANLDAGVAESLGEWTVGPCYQHLLDITSTKGANEQFGLSFTATIAFGEVDMGDSHVGGKLPLL